MTLSAISQPNELPLQFANGQQSSSRLYRLPNGNVVVIHASAPFPGAGATWHSFLIDAQGELLAGLETITDNANVPATIEWPFGVLPLANGNYGVVYHQTVAIATSLSGSAMVEWFNSSGVSLGPPVQVPGTPSATMLPVIGGPSYPGGGVADVAVAYSGGNSLVVWHQPGLPNAPGSPGASAAAVYVQKLDANGNASGTPVLVNTAYPIAGTNGVSIRSGSVTATALANGQTLVTWEYTHQTSVESPPNTGNTDNTIIEALHGRILDTNGTPIGSELTLATFDTLFWHYNIGEIGGQPLGKRLLEDVQVVALTGGGFALAWKEANDATGFADLKVQVFNASGVATGPADLLVDDFPFSASVTSSPNTSVSLLQTTALANGGFAVFFPVSYPFGFTGTVPDDISRIQLYDATGQRQGSTDYITGRDRTDGLFTDGSRIFQRDWLLRPDGTLLQIGVTNYLDEPSQLGTLVTQIIDPLSSVLSPTMGNDLAVLDAHDNYYGGRGGNDTISGLAGRDMLFGDSGNDLLQGGTGADTLEGSSGNDLYYFQAADLQAGIVDTLTDFDPANEMLRFDGVQYYEVAISNVGGVAHVAAPGGASIDATVANSSPIIVATSPTVVDPGTIDASSRANVQLSWHDWAASQSYSRYTEIYNASGVRDRQFGTYDTGAGGTWDFYWDPTNANSTWSQRFDYFNAGGQQTEQQGIYDGTAGSWIQRWDRAGTEVYDNTITYYNQAGQPIQVQSFYDASSGGGSGITTFDPTGATDYSSYTTYYDSHGHADTLNGVYDAGPSATWFVDFYQDAPADPRNYLTVLYNGAGAVTQQWITMDNGTIVNL